MNGKRDGFVYKDFKACAKTALLKRGREKVILEEVLEIVSKWKSYASDVGIDSKWITKIADYHRVNSILK